MKVLYWTPLFGAEIGGIEIVARDMVRAMRQHGHRLLVIAAHGPIVQPDEEWDDGIPVRRFHFWRSLAGRDLGLIAAIRRQTAAIQKDFQPDVVHSNFSGYTAYFQQAIAAATRAPLLVSLHSSLLGQRSGADTVLGNLLRAADWVTAVSCSTLNDARAIAPEIDGRSSVIYNGQAPAAAAAMPLPWGMPRLMTIGRLVPEKGFDLAISAMKLLRADFPHLTLHMVGAGPERAALQRQASDSGLENSIKFIGEVPHDSIQDQLNRATIVIVPSRCQESFSLVAVEAALMGRPVVATASGGLNEVVLDKKTGLLVEMENPGAIAAAVKELLAHPDLAIEMGENGKERALRIFTLERMVSEYEDIYLRLADGQQVRNAESRS
jgi:glycogen(starch) synthase